jgi:hypothetical protein
MADDEDKLENLQNIIASGSTDTVFAQVGAPPYFCFCQYFTPNGTEKSIPKYIISHQFS